MKQHADRKFAFILILGLMTALNPFSIDMYLPSFTAIGEQFGTTTARISLSLSSYFVGISVGQVIYGPVLDRFGRKRPLDFGLILYVLACFGCMTSRSADALIIWRSVQALGGCVTSVASMAMVRDLFPPHDVAKVLSLLMLILGASPLLAPTIGGLLVAHLGWQSVFVLLALMAIALLLTVKFVLPETHVPDTTVSLRPIPILKGFKEILMDPQFTTYMLSSAVSFSGLFIYLAGSTVIFMNHFHLSGQTYGWIFSLVAAGFIGTSQLNILALRKFSERRLVFMGMVSQLAIALIFLVGLAFDWFGLAGTVAMFFAFMACFGFIFSNSTAISLAPFPDRAGRASALTGFFQTAIGAAASSTVGLLNLGSTFAIVVILGISALVALAILLFGQKRIKTFVWQGQPENTPLAH